MSYGHVSELDISTFRGVKGLKLKDLSRFNLLVGRNNSGKTSILEALAFVLSRGDLLRLFRSVRERDSRSNVALSGPYYLIDVIQAIFPAAGNAFIDETFEGEISLSATLGSTVECVWARCVKETEREPDLGFVEPTYNPVLSLSIGGQQHDKRTNQAVVVDELSYRIKAGESLFRSYERSRRILAYEYVSPYGHRNSNNAERFAKIAAEDSNLRNEVVEMLAKLDPRIKDFIYAPLPGRRGGRVFVNIDGENVVPLAAMGDGIRRIFSLAASMQAAKSGVLLLDEVEAAFHVGILKNVYAWLIEEAQRLDVQIVATCHSLEAITALAEVTSDRPELPLKAYRLGLKEGLAFPISGRDLYSMVLESGLDIR
ncbi:ATPase/GTPase, AAA15 family [Cohaesibacter sp. ES.047]|nr:ATPase/GTPase, AAA15 family [Cohaesibacter sp. ES.047]